MRIRAEFNGAKIVVSDEWGIHVELSDGSGWVMGSEEWKVHDVIFEWVASLLDDARDAREQERARAVAAVKSCRDGYALAIGASPEPPERYWLPRDAVIKAIEALIPD